MSDNETNIYKNNKTTYFCKKHGLRYEYPENWLYTHLPRPECSICAIDKREEVEGLLHKTEGDLDAALRVIGLKKDTIKRQKPLPRKKKQDNI